MAHSLGLRKEVFFVVRTYPFNMFDSVLDTNSILNHAFDFQWVICHQSDLGDAD